MPFGKILYNFVIGPLQLLFECIYGAAYRAIGHPGLAIIVLSLAVNFLILPLYRRADAIQEEERKTALRLKKGVDHIKKSFKGDERFMMLQTYYRQNNYKPFDALKGSISLLLEIPFFIAAYQFLAGLTLLQGVGFGPISDLAAPDRLLTIGGFHLNLLPILMTALNLVSGVIYTRGMPLRSKLQLYGMAAVFLVLLYESPSGLVFYWTLNNLFSLAKNLFFKLRNPKKAFYILCSAAGILGFAGVMIFIKPEENTTALLLAAALALQFPLAISLITKGKSILILREAEKGDAVIFYICCVFLTVLIGVLIPTAVIKDSPFEFFGMIKIHSPLRYVFNSTLYASGLFLLWFTVFRKLASPKGKTAFGYVMIALSGTAMVNYMFFRKDYGNMSPQLRYDVFPVQELGALFINLFIILAVAVLFVLLLKRFPAIARALGTAACIAVVIMSAMNISSIRSDERIYNARIRSPKEEIRFPLDRHGKNVVVIMLDRAISSYLPFIMNERTELQRQFAGFTYYPNTISYGAYTNIGAPALFGGYEYTPEEMDRRSNELLRDKHNEALKVMPVLFDQKGFDVTVCDPTYAGYSWEPDLGIYKDYPSIKRYITKGKFTERWLERSGMLSFDGAGDQLMRNFVLYGLFRVSPLVLDDVIYDSGVYNSANIANSGTQKMNGISRANGVSQFFADPYAVLCSMDDMTTIRDNGNGTFLILTNDTTHEPSLLQAPDYAPRINVDNAAYEEKHRIRRDKDGNELELKTADQMIHYHANMSSMLELGKWFDFLRENGVYDNTRIIIVSDHGRELGFDRMRFGSESHEDAMWYQALLLVKDFNSSELTTDMTFMTNADTPVLALDDVIASPVNPFTDKPITAEAKNVPEQHIAFSSSWSVSKNNGKTFDKVTWIAVKNNVFDKNAWRVMK